MRPPKVPPHLNGVGANGVGQIWTSPFNILFDFCVRQSKLDAFVFFITFTHAQALPAGPRLSSEIYILRRNDGITHSTSWYGIVAEYFDSVLIRIVGSELVRRVRGCLAIKFGWKHVIWASLQNQLGPRWQTFYQHLLGTTRPNVWQDVSGSTRLTVWQDSLGSAWLSLFWFICWSC